jgi:ubiquinone/menaquinone biosynthesis C-methylase UbiE
LDIGCGTGTLTVLTKQKQPSATVVGIDIDPDVLSIARKKINQARVHIDLGIGTVTALPYRGETFDRVLSSLMFHHLRRDEKKRTLEEVFRVLKADGEIFIVDYGLPHTSGMRFVASVMGKLEETEDNIHGLLPEMMRASGFSQVKEMEHFSTALGPISIYGAQKPSSTDSLKGTTSLDGPIRLGQETAISKMA